MHAKFQPDWISGFSGIRWLSANWILALYDKLGGGRSEARKSLFYDLNIVYLSIYQLIEFVVSQKYNWSSSYASQVNVR